MPSHEVYPASLIARLPAERLGCECEQTRQQPIEKTGTASSHGWDRLHEFVTFVVGLGGTIGIAGQEKARPKKPTACSSQAPRISRATRGPTVVGVGPVHQRIRRRRRGEQQSRRTLQQF